MQALRQRAGVTDEANLVADNDGAANGKSASLSSSRHINLFEDLEQVCFAVGDLFVVFNVFMLAIHSARHTCLEKECT